MPRRLAATYKWAYMWPMAQVTIYLDTELERQVREAAAAAGRSLSAHIAEVLRAKPGASADKYLPADFWDKLGVIEDFPTAEEIRRGDVPDVPRVDLD